MSILITGLNMPTERESLNVTIKYNGTVLDTETGMQVAEVYEISPHGRVIEESKVLDIVSTWCPDDDGSVGKDGDLREMLDEIEALPTIIPAEEGIK